MFLEKNFKQILSENHSGCLDTNSTAGSEKNPRVLRLQSNGKIKPLLFCGIKPGGSVCCEPKNSKTEILDHEGFR